MAFANFRRVPVAQAQQAASNHKPVPAPTGGWVSAANLAGGKLPFKLYGPAAEQLDCFFPTENGIDLMGGCRKQATTNLTSKAVESLFAYIGGGTSRKMFAAANGSLYEVTAPASATVPPAAEFSGQTSNYYSSQNYATAGGNFLYALTGTDKPRLYNGATWSAIDGASVPAITGVTTSSLSHVNAYRNRLFMVQGGTLNVWALPADSLGGAAIQISLAGVFQKGGAVLFTATWSLDSGDGLDDTLVIVSTEGEVATYTGSNPADPAEWSLVGVYDLPKPLGKNAAQKWGGNLYIATEIGMLPISEAVKRDKADLTQVAASRAIGPDWVFDARTRKAFPWEIIKWPSRQRAIITNPVTGDFQTTPPQCYIINTTTGAWCRRPGWDTRCAVLHNDAVYFGSNNGCVYQMDVTGADDGAIYYAKAVFAWDHLGAVGYQKTVTSMKGQFVITAPINPLLSVSTDYAILLPSPPNVVADVASPGVWDVGLWDVAKWDTGSVVYPYSTGWVSVNLSGAAVAYTVQITCGTVGTPGATLVMLDALFDRGELML